MAEKTAIFQQIGVNDLKILDYEAHKTWSFNQNTTGSFGISTGTALNPYIGNYIGNLLPISSSTLGNEPTNPDGSLQRVSYYGLKRYLCILKERVEEIPELYETASFMSIPRNIIGTGIRRGTLCLTSFVPEPTNGITVIDDSRGHIIDTHILTASMVNISKMLGYYSTDSISSSLAQYTGSIENQALIMPEMCIVTASLENGIPSTGTVVNTGQSLRFDGVNQYGIIEHDRFAIFRNTVEGKRQNFDFAISFWVSVPGNQGGTETETVIISKCDENRDTYPFSIEIGDTNSENSIIYCVSDGLRTKAITSSVTASTGWHHIVTHQTGSNVQLYVDNVLDGILDISELKDRTSNSSDITIATDFTGSNGRYFTGSLAEIRFISGSITTDEVFSLYNRDYISGSFKQTNKVGAVDYNDGIVIVSDIHDKYDNFLTGSFNSQFQNRHKVSYSQYNLRIPGSKFNYSFNPTYIESTSITESTFRPYITSVGLYDENYDLLAMGKLSRPLLTTRILDTLMSVIINYNKDV